MSEQITSAAVSVSKGAPTDDELAALVAVLSARPADPAPPTGYEAWRAGRLAAVRAPRPGSCRS